jgi:hypothetical protein
MHDKPVLTPYQDLPCCPELEVGQSCDVLNFRRRLVFPTNVRTEQGQVVQVEVVIHTRFTRCAGPLALGDIAYSTTLLPGEQVRLATTDRRSRFSFDSESKLSYRSEQISEEQYRMRSLRAFMSDQNVTDSGSDNYSEQGKWDFHGDASGSLGFLSASASSSAKGSHNASSTRDYLREHKAHAEMSDEQSIQATRMAHSVSIGEVASRTHSEGESSEQFEAASRVFSNPNKCHALTFLFYRIDKTEKIKFELVAVERRVLDPVAPLPAPANPVRAVGQVATIPQDVPATSTKRLEVQEAAFTGDSRLRAVALSPSTPQSQALRSNALSAVATAVASPNFFQVPISAELRARALAEVDAQLVKEKLITRPGGEPTKEILAEINYERETAIPTAGVIVKSCLDDCNICEEEVQRREKLELERMSLQNKLLEKQIELLDKSQEYRCCPPAPAEDD